MNSYQHILSNLSKIFKDVLLLRVVASAILNLIINDFQHITNKGNLQTSGELNRFHKSLYCCRFVHQLVETHKSFFQTISQQIFTNSMKSFHGSQFFQEAGRKRKHDELLLFSDSAFHHSFSRNSFVHSSVRGTWKPLFPRCFSCLKNFRLPRNLIKQ